MWVGGGRVNAQVGIGTTTPNVSAVLDLTSTTQGFLPPRMTQAQRNAIVSPATGLMVLCTNCGTSGELQGYNGSTWINVTGGTASISIATITGLTCGSSTNNGTLTSGTAASDVTSVVPYTGGNGGSHIGQTVTSTGVTGLTATLNQGTFASGSGSLTYNITGTPASSGTASFTINIGGQTCTLTRTVVPVGAITGLTCSSATNSGSLNAGSSAAEVTSVIPYTGGNGGSYTGQTVTSTGVTGLTATLTAGIFASGSSSLTYTITGNPDYEGTASFSLTIGGKSCTLTRTVSCMSGATTVVDVTNPTTGKTWMDRNLGATRAATASNDQASYGDMYQWGRLKDGHQCRTSPTTATLSTFDIPGNASFITGSSGDWRSTSNNSLWQGVSGPNNPCPSGYRLPSETEWDAERASWSSQNSAGALASILKLSLPGARNNIDGNFINAGSWGDYWSSTVNGNGSRVIRISAPWNAILFDNFGRSLGCPVRCLKN